MSGPWSPSGGEPLRRRAVVRSAGVIAARLLARAEEQHARGVKFARVYRGLESVDELIPSWWGLTVLTGGTNQDQLVFAARMALFTAGARARVLWLSLDGDVDAPVFRLLTGLATVPARSVFADPQLSAQQWASLGNVRDELEAIPIQVADAHGLSLSEIRATCVEMKNEGGLDLVIVDGIERADDRLMGTLESLSEELDVPVVALVTLSDEAQGPSADGSWPRPWPLRKGSLVLRVRRHPGPANASVPEDSIRLWLDVALLGEGYRESVELRLDPGCRWIDC
jgi:hypothetical protein